jgi:hypothetical protein
MVVVERKQKAERIEELLGNSALFQSEVSRLLYLQGCREAILAPGAETGVAASSVLFLLGHLAGPAGQSRRTCLVLNKRSSKVRQPGDLCCPGGTVEHRLDPLLSQLLFIPGSPLTRWAHWRKFRRRWPDQARMLPLLLAAALREGWEEMRLNPMGLSFLGVLPAQRLLLFQRVIHPMVAWINTQTRFLTGCEVERIVAVPLSSLLNPAHYAVYRPCVPAGVRERFNHVPRDFPCFLHEEDGHIELLWGATYRIVERFLELVFEFRPPDPSRLPLIPGVIDENYMSGGG